MTTLLIVIAIISIIGLVVYKSIVYFSKRNKNQDELDQLFTGEFEALVKKPKQQKPNVIGSGWFSGDDKDEKARKRKIEILSLVALGVVVYMMMKKRK